LDIWQVRFANGVRLNLKKNDFEHDHVRVGVRIGSGRLGEPKDRPGIGAMAGFAAFFGGVQKHTDDEFQRATSGSHISANFSSNSEAFEMTASSSASEMTMAVRILTAFLTDAAFRPEGGTRVAGNVNDLYTNLETSAEGVIAQKVTAVLSGDDPRVGFPPRKTVQNYTITGMGDWLRSIFKSDPVEVTVIGDFEVDRAIDEIGRTLGAISPRKEMEQPVDQTKLHFPRPPLEKTFGYRTPDKKRPLTLAFYWPVNEPFTHVDNSRLQLLGQILQERLRVEVRVDKGETYAPSAAFEWSDVFPGLANLHCRVDVRGDRAKKITDLIKSIATKLSREGVTPDELARVRSVAMADVRRFRQSNDYWFTVLSDSQKHPWRLDNARSIEQNYASATAEEVSALASKFLTEKNLCQFTIKPEYLKP
jgi:zinc protease